MKQTFHDYIPSAIADRRAWLVNFKAQIGTNGAALGYTGPQITVIQGYCQSCIDAIDGVVTAENAYNAAIDTRIAAFDLNIPKLRTEAAKIKVNSAATAGIIDNLGLVGSHSAVDKDNYKPDLAVKLVGGLPNLTFTKHGVDGMKIMHRLKGTTAWTLLAVVKKSPYIDHIVLANAGTAETWEYCAYGIIDDQAIGQVSDMISITFVG
jgi:hypothetical protein